jgi:hypothetical protein
MILYAFDLRVHSITKQIWLERELPSHEAQELLGWALADHLLRTVMTGWRPSELIPVSPVGNPAELI